MKRWSRYALALVHAFVALAALVSGRFARAQDIAVVDVPLVAGAPMQFQRLAAPAPPLPLQRAAQDRYGFLWLSAADGLRRYDGYGFMKVPDGQAALKVGHIIGQSFAS